MSQVLATVFAHCMLICSYASYQHSPLDIKHAALLSGKINPSSTQEVNFVKQKKTSNMPYLNIIQSLDSKL